MGRYKGMYKGKTILVVDDEETVRNLAALMLRGMGHDVILAADGQEALRLFRQSTELIDTVLLDLTMPRMRGEEVYRRLRGLKPDLDVVLMSGFDRDTATEFVEGTPQFLAKPFTLRDLRAHIP